jgi:hypothetical protein
VPVTDPGANDPSEQRSELHDITMLELTGGLTSAQAQRSRERGRTLRREATAVEDCLALGVAFGFPGICVMDSPATSQYR